MRLLGPDRFALTFDARQFEVRSPEGGTKVRGRAARRGPKLYIFSLDEEPIYVGATRQAIRARLRLGWSAKGESGYHGYAFRRTLRRADLDVWYFERGTASDPLIDVETIEAEIVFLIRSKGQWPKFQTEIHFHPSQAAHRDLAAKVLRHYRIAV